MIDTLALMELLTDFYNTRTSEYCTVQFLNIYILNT